MVKTDELPETVRWLLSCPECKSELRVIEEGGLLHADVLHEDGCPWFLRRAGEVW